jgi:hypothetical protein
MSNDEDLKDLLSETAEAIKRLTENPSTWGSWIIYLLKELENQALDANPMNNELYREMLGRLQDSLRLRERTGGW